jgi:hypothetical protein
MLTRASGVAWCTAAILSQLLTANAGVIGLAAAPERESPARDFGLSNDISKCIPDEHQAPIVHVRACLKAIELLARTLTNAARTWDWPSICSDCFWRSAV